MRRLFFSLILISILLVMPIHALAHPGRTDSSGGHRNRSTGEYHYHHGYSAHQHKDLDGDGKLDCPYEFNDNANYNNSSSNSTIEQDSIVEESKTEDSSPEGLLPKNANWKHKLESLFFKLLFSFFAVICCTIFLFFLCIFPPLNIIIEFFSELCGGSQKAYYCWTAIFVVVPQIFFQYNIWTLK